MNFIKKIGFFAGVFLAFISISAMASYYRPKKKSKEINKDY